MRMLAALTGTDAHISLDMLGWDTSMLLARVAEILLREKLDYEVGLVQWDGSGADSMGAYARLAANAVDVVIDAWPDPAAAEPDRQHNNQHLVPAGL